jgi:electron transport complex protein RnfD
MLFSGALMCGAFFILTDPVSIPASFHGKIIFVILAGLLIVLIRVASSYPDAIAFATLLANAIVPLIDYFVKDKVYGK